MDYNPFSKLLGMMPKVDATATDEIVKTFSKLIRFEKKAQSQRAELHRQIFEWGNKLQDENARKLLNEFAKCIKESYIAENDSIHKQENVCFQVSNVQKREKKAMDLNTRKLRLYKQLRAREGKKGEDLSVSLAREELEELDISIQVVEEQMIRFINSALRGCLADYVFTVQAGCMDVRGACDIFFECLNYDSSGSFKRHTQEVIEKTPPRSKSSNHGILGDVSKTVNNHQKSNDIKNENCLECEVTGHKSNSTKNRVTSKLFGNTRPVTVDSDAAAQYPGNLGLRIPSNLGMADPWVRHN
ncbi:unnamed protein product [Kuraishia capsulata CBS 1993]|uniref:Uncharacterized protein n=1 Tax=Kuraishia capsulata CBS 1993 TaxID=1382522 RepID=W6MTP3_9ASCO|nr:uncharacterized protein KUCA_T00004565001 [Kuraishia capsulata CBS 1993]CDK28582.1 unnamed protein product [Kuraishia capsulata CBS 1993]